MLWGNWTPYFFVQSIAAQVGVPSNIAFYLVAIINGLSLPGRIIPGIIADKIGPWNVFVPSAISAGILTFACIGIHSAAGLYTYCVLYGLFSGTRLGIPYNLRRCYLIAGTVLCTDMSRYEKNRNDVWNGNGRVVVRVSSPLY